EPLGLTRPHEELQRYFSGPAAYRKAMLPGLVERVLGRADRYLAEGRPAKALACLNHVLALDPGNTRARGLLEAMDQARRRQRKTKLAKRGALFGTLAAAALGLIGYEYAMTPAPPLASVADLHAPLPELRPAPQASPLPEAPKHVAPAPAPAPSLASASAPRDPPARPAGTVQAAAGARVVSVSVQVRPWAYVQVDDGPKSPEALAEHRLQL